MPRRSGGKGSGMGARKLRIWVPEEAQPKSQKSIAELREDFIGVISHDLRTPISIVKEGISLLLDEIPGKINEEQAAVLRSAKDNIERLARTIDHLLESSASKKTGGK